MKMFPRTAAGATAVILVLSLPVSAQFVTSGDVCAPVNVGKALRVIQNLRGVTINNSASETIAVSCPLVQAAGESSVAVAVVLQNKSGETQSPRCVLREKDLSDNDIATLVVSRELQPSESDVLEFDTLVLESTTNRVNLTCTLPPNNGMGLLAIDSFTES